MGILALITLTICLIRQYTYSRRKGATDKLLAQIQHINLTKEQLLPDDFHILVACMLNDIINNPSEHKHHQQLLAIWFSLNLPFLNTRLNTNYLLLNQRYIASRDMILNKWSAEPPDISKVSIIIMLCYCSNAISHHRIIDIRERLQNHKIQSKPINIPNPYIESHRSYLHDLTQTSHDFEYQHNIRHFLMHIKSTQQSRQNLIKQAFIELSHANRFCELERLNYAYHKALETLSSDYTQIQQDSSDILTVLGYCALTLKHPVIQSHREQLDRISHRLCRDKKTTHSILH